MLQNTSGYIQNLGNAQNQPREIGILQRVEGVRNGLEEIHARLRAFTDRLAGAPNKETNPTPSPVGIIANLNIADERIREIYQIIGGLEETF